MCMKETYDAALCDAFHVSYSSAIVTKSNACNVMSAWNQKHEQVVQQLLLFTEEGVNACVTKHVMQRS